MIYMSTLICYINLCVYICLPIDNGRDWVFSHYLHLVSLYGISCFLLNSFLEISCFSSFLSAAVEKSTDLGTVVANSRLVATDSSSKTIATKHLKTVTLNSSNCFVWCEQFIIILRGNDLLDYVHGDVPLTDAIAIIQDQLIQWRILSAISASVLMYVTSCNSSAEVWSTLQLEFASSTCSQVLTLSENSKHQEGKPYCLQVYCRVQCCHRGPGNSWRKN